MSGDWVGWRGDWCFFLVGGSFDRLCQVIGWAGGVNGVFFLFGGSFGELCQVIEWAGGITGGFFWSVVHLVNCVK